jgi:DNA-binding PadR family transcriptional regulator
MTRAAPKMTQTTQAVLRALLAEPSKAKYGLQICREAGLPSGTIHPILARLELEYQWLESFLEEIDPAVAKRPQRRYYRFTKKGAEEARLALAQASAKATKLRLGTQRPGLAGA